MNPRFLADASSDALQARFGDAVDAARARALSASADARILALDGALGASVCALLEGEGIVVVATGATTLIAGSRAAFARARARALPEDAAVVDALLVTLERAARPAASLRLRERVLDLRDEARVMGIVNVTPDSFYERAGGTSEALERARAIAAAGGAIVDIGGRSYAHWNAPVAAEEERARVVPAIAAIRAADVDVAISVDTTRAAVARAALAAGAHLVNDCSGLSDEGLAEAVAAHDAALVVMHLKGRLNVREPDAYIYGDALAEIVAFLAERTERAMAAGVRRDAIAIDPGLEFGKEPETDLEILERFGELRALGFPILFASSRKSFIGRVFDRPARELLVPSLATAAIGIAAGARILRVHDVGETVQLARMLAAVAPRRRARLAIADRMPGTPLAAGNSREGRAV